MKTTANTITLPEKFLHLPEFASFLLNHRLQQFIRLQLDEATKLDMPLLKFFEELPEEQQRLIFTQTNTVLLLALAENNGQKYILESMQRWLTNQLPIVDRDSIVAEDITLVNHIRKQAMLAFVPVYTKEATEIIDLIKEIDLFITVSITQATNEYLKLYRSRLQETDYFIQKVAETVPGAIYVYDVAEGKNIYANSKLAEIIGYEPGELNTLGTAQATMLVHADDRESLLEHFKTIGTDQKETSVVKYRIRRKDGNYQWLAAYESAFKTNVDGTVTQTIGIALNIDNEQAVLAELQQREQQLQEAQNIAQLGHFYWDFATTNSFSSPKTWEILEMKPGDKDFFDRLHPDDREKISQAIQQAKESGTYSEQYRVNTSKGERHVWGRGVVQYENGEAVGMRGTVMDVTEQNHLIQRLAEADLRHKQAEALAHIGTYDWNLATNEVRWSDEMYRIFHVDKKTPITYDFFLSHIHTDNREHFESIIRQSLQSGNSYDFNFRIQTKTGEKILQTRGHVLKDEKGLPQRVVGSDQDITEKQQLIDRLVQTEIVYKQVEEIADMGNWRRNLLTGTIEWTDQLFRIYGLNPQKEAITLERFLSFVHPDDRDTVAAGVTNLAVDDDQDYTFRIVTPDGTEKWLRSIARVLRNDAGEAIMVVGTEQNVTEKQRLIRKLEESQSLYKQAQELSKLGNFSWKPETDELFWSDEVYRIYDKPPGSTVHFADAFTPIIDEHKAFVQAAIEMTIAEKKGTSVSYAIQGKNGKRRYVNLETDVVLTGDGKVATIIGTAQDVTEKELLIERLRESEKLFKQAQSLAHLGNWTYDLTTEQITWSDELYDIYEREKASPPTLATWLKYLQPDEGADSQNIQNIAIADQLLHDKVQTITLANGKHKVLHRRGEMITDKSGRGKKIIGTTQDITEQYNTQLELRDSQTFIRKITDATPSIIASYNVNSGQFNFISEGIQKLLGYSRGDVLNKGLQFFAEVIHPDDLPALREKKMRTLEAANSAGEKKEVLAEFTYRMKHRQGDYRWFHTYGTVFDYNSEGKVEHVLNITLDVTEQKEAVETIREQEYFIQQIADASPTILYLFDVSGQRIAYINREAFFVLGYLPEEIVEEGENITAELYHPDDLQLLPARTQSQKNFQQVDSMIQYECRMRHKDGGYRWLLVREIVFKADEKGAVTQIIGAALDITRRKEMERTILQNSHQLEQSNASLEEFAYIASHDLKEPLRKISTFGDRLVASHAERLGDDGKVYLTKIVDASQRMQNMISDLLSISMISGNRQFERVNLEKIMEETLQTLEYKIEQQQAVVRYEALPEAAVVPSQFRQLFQNLLANSLKFVREGVQPVVTVSACVPTDDEKRMFNLTKPSGYLKLVFSDNGIGFEMEYAQRIFAIFQRLHGRSEYEGSGIGLAICKKIAEHHGGIIFATGQPGAGASFTVIIPA